MTVSRHALAALAAIAAIAAPLAAAESADVAKTAAKPAAAATAHKKIIVYYVHGGVRCASCLKLEAYAKEAVTKGFPQQVKDGTVEFKSVSTDEPGNAHFNKDYQLFTKSVVVTEWKDGKQLRFKFLAKVWQLLGDEKAYVKYVQGEVQGFLK